MHPRLHPSQDEDDLVREYIPLVKHIASRMVLNIPLHIDFQDLYSSGLRGLLMALRRFEPGHKASFETYAKHRIHGAMIDDFRALDWIPRRVRRLTRKVQETVHTLEQQAGHFVTVEEVAKELKVPERMVKEAQKPVTLIKIDMVGIELDDDLHEELEDPNQESPALIVSRQETKEILMAKLNQLPDRQRMILLLYYFKNMRMLDIARSLDITQARACQIRTKALHGMQYNLHRADHD
jgi:RNA polymerase sigma factor for flagellar operon FliA